MIALQHTGTGKGFRTMNRRGFLKGMLATGVAPYVVTAAGVLMPVRKLWEPGIAFVQSGTGATSLTLQAVIGQRIMVSNQGGRIVTIGGDLGLLGNKSLTLSDGEMAMFVYDGSDWREAYTSIHSS